ncbi:MAG: redoxin family protein [bacterium]|nr:redoxin family protein [bacterium]
MRSPSCFRARHLLAVALVLLAGTSCRVRPAPAPPPTDTARLYALLLNGGGLPAQNYQSHLLHVRELRAMLTRMGVPDARVAVLTSDGDDPGQDVAVRQTQPEEEFWLLEGSRLEAPLRTPIVYEDSTVEGTVLAPATQAELRRWFDTAGRTLTSDDTLLLYVTDHGTRNAKDLGDNAITLWGVGESISVRELGALLATLDPGVRVVTVMSQCFSGSFANLPKARSGRELPDGKTCGYFSSTADRPAYGCYPENRGKNNVGHSFHFLDGLARTGQLEEAHREVLVLDATPDVPLRTSDVWLEARLTAAAAAAGQPLNVYADLLLRRAWKDQGRFEPDIRLLDDIGRAFGSFSPRSLAEVEAQAQQLAASGGQLRQHGKAWDAALDSARRANLDRFTTAHPAWRERLAEPKVRDLPQPEARALTHDLLADLGPATRKDTTTSNRLRRLRTQARTAREVSYRMEVRLGALLRMRTILLGVAGRVWLADDATAAERDAWEALRRCERLVVPVPGVRPGAELARPERFPALEDDVELADGVLPAWMGIQFRQATDDLRAAHGLAPGAASILAVYPDSPAKAAGLQAGDIVVGPPGRPFQERDQVREWTMLSEVDTPAPLEVLRDGRPLAVTLLPKPMPQKWPKLAAPPKVGAPAPPLRLSHYRGDATAAVAPGSPHLLFFWATWCGVCKASLPELDAFARERGIPVVAVTDEGAERLDPFFKSHKGPFPPIVATDTDRQAFLAYGVSGMPTFVLVGADGSVQSYAVGYTAAKGLGLDGWAWSKRPAAP